MIASRTAAEVLVQNELAEVDEADRAVQFGLVEERELLLVAQHLDGRLAQHGEVQRGMLWGGVGEHELVREVLHRDERHAGGGWRVECIYGGNYEC